MLVWFNAEMLMVLAAVARLMFAPAAKTIVPVDVAAPVPRAATPAPPVPPLAPMMVICGLVEA